MPLSLPKMGSGILHSHGSGTMPEWFNGHGAGRKRLMRPCNRCIDQLAAFRKLVKGGVQLA